MKPGYLMFLAFYLAFTFGLVLFVSLPPSSAPSEDKSIDHSPAMQARRLVAIQRLQKEGLIKKVECEAPQRLWILPAFYGLTMDDKSVVASLSYAYCFPQVATHNVLLLKDNKTGKTAGQFSRLGLEMQ